MPSPRPTCPTGAKVPADRNRAQSSAWRLGASSIATNDRSCAFASCLTRRRPYGRRHRLAIPHHRTERAVKHRDLISALVATAATAVLLAGCGGAGGASAPANSSDASSEVSVDGAGRAGAPGKPTIVIEHGA